MTTRWMVAAGVALALAGCGGTDIRDQIRAVGSSTVYPFTTAVAEQFVTKNPDAKSPIIESTGTGAGMKLFCAGVGQQHPDVANASRRIKQSEFDDCRRNGVTDIIELQIGIDGLAMIEAANGPALKLTTRDIYAALAATPFGRAQTARTWRDVNPALPAIPIQVYGPPATSGTRDSLVELILSPGCDTDPAMKALKARDEDRHKTVCTKVREDGPFIESGENDNLIVQKLAANPTAMGVLGYSFLEENASRVRGIAIDGVMPSETTIADFSYPGARALFVYIKGAHVRAIPGLKAFAAEFAAGWAPGGYLSRRGLISAPAEVRARSGEAAARLTPMSGEGLG